MRYKLAIFDFDGTLADSSGWFLEILNYVAAHYRFRQVSRSEIDELRGKTSREIVRQMRIPFWKMPFIARHMRGLARDAGDRISLFPGIEKALTDLSTAGLKIGVVSSNAEDTIRRTLGGRLAASIDHYECGASMFGKARLVRRLLARAGLDSREAILIGDETRDIEAARQAGVAAGAVCWGYINADALRAQGPVAVFTSVEEMADFLHR
jgi:phosphoglycolate phosphatase